MKKKDGSSFDEIFSSITPQNNFDPKKVPVKPDYEDKYFWAAFPGKESVVNLTTEKPADPKNFNVDCFFVHPTGFFLKDWNFKGRIKEKLEAWTGNIQSTVEFTLGRSLLLSTLIQLSSLVVLLRLATSVLADSLSAE